MVIKLKSLLAEINRSLPWLVRAGIFGFALTGLVQEGMPLPWVIGFVILTGFLYVQPIFRSFSLLTSFVVLTASALTFGYMFSQIVPAGMIGLGFGLLFYILLGIKHLAFIHRQRWYYVLHLALLYLAGLFVYASDKSSYFWLESVLIFLVALLLSREFFRVNEVEKSRRVASAGWLVALLSVEFLWTLGLLPIGFINSATVFTATLFIVEEFLCGYFKHQLTAQSARRLLAVLIFVYAVLFFSSPWKP